VSSSADNLRFFSGLNASKNCNEVNCDFRTMHDHLIKSGFHLESVTAGSQHGSFTHFYRRPTGPDGVASTSTPH
jgi:hypothetical protein